MDCSIVPTRFPEIFQVSTTDFFFPLVEDPYLQGRIAAANVLSDMYALGLYHCDNLLCLAGACSQMQPQDRDIVLTQMLKGFNDVAKEAETRVTGGQTVFNAWPLIGGVAMAAAREEDFIRPDGAVTGDVIVLTKPLGTQVAVNVNVWIVEGGKSWEKASDVITTAEGVRAYQMAMESMARLNRNGAKLMHKFKAHAATDVTGFGILGHATNLAVHQKAKVDFVLDVLPIIRGMAAVERKLNTYSLLRGFSSETSGGLLVCLPSLEAAQGFCKEIQEIDKQPAWIIGRVVDGSNTARIAETPTIIEI